MQLILVNTCVSLFAGLMPVPGGVGVAEAGYTYGLQAIGVPSAIAVATALAFRLVTFYLPPVVVLAGDEVAAPQRLRVSPTATDDRPQTDPEFQRHDIGQAGSAASG